MKEVVLNNGNSIPAIGLGTWLSEAGQVYNIVKEAIKRGYRHIDCAACYGNEKEVGQALKEVLQEGIVKRSDLFITSKLWNNAHEQHQVVPALKQTLADLQLEYLDLYLIHWPVCFKATVAFPESISDYVSLDDIPIAETWLGMESAVELGLTKSIGVSNFSSLKIEKLLETAKIKPVMNQVEVHPYFAQNELVKYCHEKNIQITCYSPLGSSGRPDNMKASDEPSLLENPVITSISKELDCEPAQVILSWSLSRGLVVIPKTVTPARASTNLNSSEIKLTDVQTEKINKLNSGFRYVNGSFFTPAGGPYTLANLWDE